MSEELRAKLEKYGYSITESAERLVIRSKNSSSYLFAFLMIAAGFLLIPVANDPKLIALVSLLILYPILTFRRNSREKLIFDSNSSIVKTYTKGIVPVVSKFQLVDYDVELYTYSRLSYTSAMEPGNKEYFADITLNFNQNEKLELFHFGSRDEEKLNFVPAIIPFIEGILKNLQTPKQG